MLTPRFLTNLVVAVAAIYVAAMALLIYSAPYAGFELTANDDEQLVVSRVDDAVEREGLAVGDVITRLTSATGYVVELNESYYPSATGRSRQLHDSIASHINSSNVMYTVLSEDSVLVETSSGKSVIVAMDRSRPWSSVRVEVWYCIFLSVVCWLVPALVWSWRPVDKDITYMALSGLGLGAATISAATMYQIEMFFPQPPFFWLIFVLVGFGNFAFVTFAAAAFLYFPQKLPWAETGARALFALVLVYTFWVFADGWQVGVPLAQQLLYFEYNEVYLIEVGVYLLILVAVALQGFYNRRNPVRRAEVLWIAFAAVMTPVAFFGLYLVPVMLGHEALVTRTWTTTLLVVGFLLLAAGVSRLRFLSLERYVGAVYQWTFVALLFVALDAALVVFLNINPASSTVIMAALLLFVYLPFRQWLWGRLTRMRLKDYEGIFGDAADAMVEGALQERSPEEVWPEVLQRVYRPVSIEAADGQAENRLREQGQVLEVAANQFADGCQLYYADRGSRVFTQDDVDLLNSLQRLFVRMFDYRDGVEKGQLKERERIRRDLHDQVGSKLLSMIYRARDEESMELATETMDQLREIMMALKREPVSLQQLIADLRTVSLDSARSLGLKAEVADSGDVSGYKIPSFQYLNLVSIVRELINNSAKHAGADQVFLTVEVAAEGLSLRYHDNGSGFQLENIERGHGLSNIESRAEEMHSELTWNTQAGGQLSLQLPVHH